VTGPPLNWTHPSARLLLKDGEPVEVITKRARRLVCQALDLGWSGPPFDPVRLADALRMELVASDEVLDARTVPVGASRFRIEFNPSRPLARLRYSVAHEIAHTLFADCGAEIRHRGRHEGQRKDEWQLEALCNVAAAELLMPLGDLPEEAITTPRAVNFSQLRERYAVSTEALLIRLARLSPTPRAAFCASRVEDGPGLGRYRLNYLVSSSAWARPPVQEQLLPKVSIVGECTAIGFTTSGKERWTGDEALEIEAMGIPPYPGASYPRVAGLVQPVKGQHEKRVDLLRYVNGDATQLVEGSDPRLLVHVVNDRTANWGGAGFAQAIRSRLPQVQQDFQDWVSNTPGSLQLGRVRIVHLGEGLAVASIVAQKGYGTSASPRIRYLALEEGLEHVAVAAVQQRASVHMPRIGSGAGGGDWTIIEELVRQTLCERGIKVTVYSLPGSSQPRNDAQTALPLEIPGYSN